LTEAEPQGTHEHVSDASDRDEHEHEHERERHRLERILPELIKRAIETGYEKLTEGPENVRQFVSELKLPKEALALLLAQVEESKNGLYRAVAREVRDFLDKTNLSEELVKVLTGLSFEVRTEIRFIPNDARPGARPKPDVQSRVGLRRTSAPPPPDAPAGVDDPPPEVRRPRHNAETTTEPADVERAEGHDAVTPEPEEKAE
jgi:hypothetical protein